MTRLGMIIDLKRCIGCNACTVACKASNATPPEISWCRVLQREWDQFPHVKKIFVPILCMHCENPPCLRACPTKAIEKLENGVVIVNQNKCCGSRACVTACPYGALYFYDRRRWYFPDGPTPYETHFQDKYRPGTAQKCDFCRDRVGQGMKPACVSVCLTQCRIFGDLDDPESEPSRYIKERGTPMPLRPEAGTKPSVLYLR